MKKNFIWTKGVFSSQFQLYSETKQIAFLNEKPFSQSASGKINDKQFYFQTKGFMIRETSIIDEISNREIGKISYNSWKTKAVISLYSGEVYNWKYLNMWTKQSCISKNNEVVLDIKSNFNRGTIEASDTDELLLLCGLFLKSYHRQATAAVIVAAFLPILSNIIN